eukprot:9703726-Lingulodinium_polyedra.AAC.1
MLLALGPLDGGLVGEVHGGGRGLRLGLARSLPLAHVLLALGLPPAQPEPLALQLGPGPRGAGGRGPALLCGARRA